MKGEVCKQKFAFCKFEERCEKDTLRRGVIVQKPVKKGTLCVQNIFLEGFCKFGKGCAYHHQAQEQTVNESEIIVKVDKLGKKL